MGVAADVVQDAFRTEERGVDWRSGVAGAVAAVGPLAIGVALGETVAGLTAALGGLNTALCVPAAGLRERLWWGSLGVLLPGLAVALADLCAAHDWSLVMATLLFVGACSLLRGAGPAGALLGFVGGAIFTIMAGIPVAPEAAGQRVLWFLLGALPALALMIAARRGPTRSAHVARDFAAALGEAVRHDRTLHAHARRVGVAVAAGTLLYAVLDLPHGYWVPLTTLAIMQPGEHATQVRAVQRAAGTLGGAALILAITAVTDLRAALLAGAACTAFWLYALDERGYFWLVVLLTPTVLLMLSVVDFQGDDIALDRVADSTLGIGVGLLIGEAAWRIPTAAR